MGSEAKTETGGGASVAAAERCDRTNQAEERASAMGMDWWGWGAGGIGMDQKLYPAPLGGKPTIEICGDDEYPSISGVGRRVPGF